jgi:hypothetical protein
MPATLTYPGKPRPRLVAGLIVSLLLHAVLLTLLRAPSAPPQRDERRWAQPLTVLLVPPRVFPQPIRAPEPATEPRPPKRAQASASPIAPRMTPPEVGKLPAPVAVTPEETTAAAEPAKDEPSFDQDAARKSARGMYDAVKPPVTNWAAEKLNKDKEWKETKMERFGTAVAKSAREDCRTAHAGAGLLAPLFWLADKKDSGCKL